MNREEKTRCGARQEDLEPLIDQKTKKSTRYHKNRQMNRNFTAPPPNCKVAVYTQQHFASPYDKNDPPSHSALQPTKCNLFHGMWALHIHLQWVWLRAFMDWNRRWGGNVSPPHYLSRTLWKAIHHRSLFRWTHLCKWALDVNTKIQRNILLTWS